MTLKSRLMRTATAAAVADVFDKLSTEALVELVNNIAENTDSDAFDTIVFQDMSEVDAYLEQYRDDLPELLRFMRDRCGDASGELGAFDVDSPYFWVQQTGGLWSYEKDEVREEILAKAEQLATVITDADTEDPALTKLKNELIEAMTEESDEE